MPRRRTGRHDHRRAAAQGAPAVVSAHKTLRVAAITVAGIEALASGTPTPRQRDALTLLAAAPGGCRRRSCSRGVAADAVSRLVRAGFVSVRQDRVDRDPFDAAALRIAAADPLRQLTAEQASALARLRTSPIRAAFTWRSCTA